MRITRTGKPDNYYYYIIEDYRDENGHRKTRTVESLGCAKVIRETYKVADAESWCKEYVAQKNQELQLSKVDNKRELNLKLREDLPKNTRSCIFNIGYLILEKLYYSFGLSNICDEIMKAHPHITGFDLNEVLKTMIFGRIICPSSKLALVSDYQHRFLEDSQIELQHVYRAMDLLCDNSSLIQNRLYQYSSETCNRDVSRLYYDCTNFYTEKELEDCDVDGKDEEWHEDHTLRKYGKSKENRPNPIVQMGLFMDGNGMPLGLCINPGNTNEQETMIPLEREIIRNFNTTDIIVCTDCGLSGEKNRRFNNLDEDNPLVKLGLSGKRRFICTQSVRKLNGMLKSWVTDKTDWSYTEYGADGKTRIARGFDLESLNNPEIYAKHYHTVFFKERTTAEKGLDSRLIATYSLKYRDYVKSLRERKIKRACKMIENGTYASENDRSPKSLIRKTYTTKKGEEANCRTASLDMDKITADEQFDGFYAVTTNVFCNEMPVSQIAAISSRRWEIEECFRIMKTDLEARPFYHSKDQRITSHFLTCFIALLLIRGIEHKLSENNNQQVYPEGKYTVSDILKALRELQVISIDGGAGYQPDYNDSKLITELLECFELHEFSRMVVMKDTIKKILKKIKVSPKMIKIKK